MKKVTCKVCGSHNLINDGDIYICNDCGMKYKASEISTLLVETDNHRYSALQVVNNNNMVARADSNDEINKYINLALDALKSEDSDRVYTYCNKIHEIDLTNAKGWDIEARGINFGNSLNNNRIHMSISAAKNAIKYYNGDNVEKYAESLYLSILAAIYNLEAIAYSMPTLYCAQFIHLTMMMEVELASTLPNLSSEFLNNQINLIKEKCRNSENAILPSKRKLYAAFLSYNGGYNYGVTIENNLKAHGRLKGE